MIYCVKLSVYSKRGFSLIEVVLAIGIFLVTVLALVGLLGPTLQSVDEVEKTDEVSSIVNTVNAFLQNSPDIALTAGGSKFNAVYNAIQLDNGYATIFVYRWYDDSGSGEPIIRLEIGFEDNQGGNVGANSVVNTVNPGGTAALFTQAAGTIYRVVLTPSSVIPVAHVTSGADGAYPRYTLNKPIGTYPEGSFAMEVRIFAEELLPGGTFNATKIITNLAAQDPIFTYNTAIVR
jgi:type II secretory pathway pseudopilin PulG